MTQNNNVLCKTAVTYDIKATVGQRESLSQDRLTDRESRPWR